MIQIEMVVIDEFVCPARGSFSLSTKVLSVHVYHKGIILTKKSYAWFNYSGEPLSFT